MIERPRNLRSCIGATWNGASFYPPSIRQSGTAFKGSLRRLTPPLTAVPDRLSEARRKTKRLCESPNKLERLSIKSLEHVEGPFYGLGGALMPKISSYDWLSFGGRVKL